MDTLVRSLSSLSCDYSRAEGCCDIAASVSAYVSLPQLQRLAELLEAHCFQSSSTSFAFSYRETVAQQVCRNRVRGPVLDHFLTPDLLAHFRLD